MSDQQRPPASEGQRASLAAAQAPAGSLVSGVTSRGAGPARQAPDAARPLRVVVCGEVRSGKSTVLNALLRERVLPDNLGALTRPAVILKGRAGALARYREDDAGVTLVDDIDALRGAGRIHLFSDLPHLAGVEVTELPLTTAEQLTAGQIATMRAADALIWVTIASQAWRLTERQILDAMAHLRPKRALLVVSRADKLRSDADRERIIDRLRSATKACFEDVICLGAARQALEAAARCEEAWAGLGGPDLVSQLIAWRNEHQAQSGIAASQPEPEPLATNAPADRATMGGVGALIWPRRAGLASVSQLSRAGQSNPAGTATRGGACETGSATFARAPRLTVLQVRRASRPDTISDAD